MMQAIAHALTSNLLLATATLAGAIFGIWGLVVTYRSRPRRVITYAFPVRKQLFFNEYVGYGGFDLRLNDKAVRDLFYLQLRVRNDGTEPIYKKDLLRPIQLQFDKPVTVFPVSIKRLRSDIGTKTAIETQAGNTVIIFDTDLIEPGDEWLTDIIYESDGTPVYKVEGRLIGGELRGKRSDPADVKDDMRIVIFRRYKPIMLPVTVLGTAAVLSLLKLLVGIAFPSLDIKTLPSWVSPSVFLLAFVAVMLCVNSVVKKKMSADFAEYTRTIEERRRILEGPAGKQS